MNMKDTLWLVNTAFIVDNPWGIATHSMIHLLMSPKEKVVSSTGAFFIFFSKKL
jgi:hypothetical protein